MILYFFIIFIVQLVIHNSNTYKKIDEKKNNFVEQTFAIDPISIISRNSEIGGSDREK